MSAQVLMKTLDLSHEDWLRTRKLGIGGSEAAAIAGLNPWSSPLRIYMDKVSDEVEAIPDNERMRIGRDLEDYVAKRFADETGKKVRRLNSMLQHKEHTFMLANLDRVVVGENAFLECKTTNSYAKKEWEEGIPLHYELQCLHYMAVGGYDCCYIAALIGNEKFIWKRIERDEETIQNLIHIEHDFWHNNVLKQIPPEPDGSSEYSEILKKKYAYSEDSQIELDGSFVEKVERIDVLKDLIKDMDTEKTQLEQQIQAQMEFNERALVGERVITWKTCTSNKFDSSSFKKDYPELYEQYINQSSYRRFVIK